MNDVALVESKPDRAPSLRQLLLFPPELIEMLPVAVYACDADGRILWFNERAVGLWGRRPANGATEERFCGAHRLHFGGRPIRHDESPMAQVLASGKPARGIEGMVERPDGSRVWVTVHVEPVTKGAGQLVGAINCFHETTELHRARTAAAESEKRARQVLEALPAAVYTTDAEGRITYFNHAAVELSGHRPELGDRWCITWRLYAPDGTPLPHDECPMAVALKERRPVRGMEIIAERPDGARVPVMPFPTPICDETGEFVGAVNMLVDITEAKRVEDSLIRRMDEQTALYRFTDRLYRAESVAEMYEAALDAIAAALRCPRASILLFDESGVMRFVAWRGLSDGYRKAVEGHSPWKPGDRDPSPICVSDIEEADEPESLKAVVTAEGIRGLAFIPLVANGGIIGKFMAYYESPHVFGDDEVNLALTIARQLGFSIERRRAEEQRTLLLNELNHRVKNTLATVQALAMQTLRNTERSAEARDLFDARLAALSQAHDVLTSQSWSGASLEEIVRRALAPFELPGGRMAVEGPEVRLSPKQALALSMALHELATNAAKYGALSNETGRIRVAWELAPSSESIELRLTWTEEGGPPVRPPARKGFGSRLIERSLASELGGAVTVDYRYEGLVCTVKSPVGWGAAPTLMHV
ncbi:MAG TPA: HWE histidine kinase domain-containing protein [Afifellaceae bacterium]|nr:HWE histidine kinase domain-containing protein [Afifellaceae bacterium]